MDGTAAHAQKTCGLYVNELEEPQLRLMLLYGEYKNTIRYTEVTVLVGHNMYQIYRKNIACPKYIKIKYNKSKYRYVNIIKLVLKINNIKQDS